MYLCVGGIDFDSFFLTISISDFGIVLTLLYFCLFFIRSINYIVCFNFEMNLEFSEC